MLLYNKTGLPGEQTRVELLFPRITINKSRINDFGEKYTFTDVNFNTGFEYYREEGIYWELSLQILGLGLAVLVQKGY